MRRKREPRFSTIPEYAVLIYFVFLNCRYFGQTKYPSFQRQLNLYGFSRFAHGKDKGSYYHLCFVRGHSTLVRQMVRRKINGNKVRHTIEPSSEPDFYHPFWKNHFEATYPPKLLELQCAAVVKALCNKAISDNSSSTNNNTSDLMNIPSAVIESETTSNTNEKSKLNDQVMILPRLPVSPIPSTITSTTPPSSTMDSLGECSAVWATLEESVDEGDMFTFEGIPFHFLDGQDSDELQNSATSILGTEDDNFSVSSVRRFGSGSFLGSSCADLLLLDQEPLLLNNNLAV